MTGHDAVPVGRAVLAGQLRALGVTPGCTLLVHASLRAIGPVEGGAETMVAALRDAVGQDGTLVAPTFTSANSLTSRAHLHRIDEQPPALRTRFIERMPPFDPERDPAWETGAVAERIRSSKGALRSDHPQTSFAALGPLAPYLVSDHGVGSLLGERSPLARLYRARAVILLLGVGYGVCSAFHLAEYRVPRPPRRTYTCRIRVPEGVRWCSVVDVALDDGDFAELGRHVEALPGPDGPLVRKGSVGNGQARLLPLTVAVDSAVDWLQTHRTVVGESLSG